MRFGGCFSRCLRQRGKRVRRGGFGALRAFAGSPALLLCLALPGLPAGYSGSTNLGKSGVTEKKRPYEVPDEKREAGLYLTGQRSLYDVNQLSVSLPVSWTRYHSDSLDWRFEGWVSHTSTRGDGWISAVAAPGFTYWLDGATAVTPFLRTGFARDRTWRKSFAVYGADVLLERSITLRPGAPQHEHRFIVLDARAGFLAHHGIGGAGSFQHYFLNAGLSYDVPVLVESWDARHRKRAKFTVGVENHFGNGRPLDRLVVAALSIRSETAREGLLIRKLDLSAGIGPKSRYRLTIGYMRGF